MLQLRTENRDLTVLPLQINEGPLLLSNERLFQPWGGTPLAEKQDLGPWKDRSAFAKL